MAKNITLTESQFKDILRMKLKEEANNGNEERYLEYDEIIQLLHRTVDDDFLVYFSNGRTYNCSAIHEKGEIFDAICSGHPTLLPNGRIGLRNDAYGNFEMENLIMDRDEFSYNDDEDDY